MQTILIYGGGCSTSVLGFAESEHNNIKETKPDTHAAPTRMPPPQKLAIPDLHRLLR
jgi:hypothetical protein